jgi:tRNA dimethylallyltransferase
MQLYAGLPILTNKIPPREQCGIPHHLLGCIGVHEQPWVVGTFVQHALRTIDDIRARGKLPILVGGTHYYTQALLFHDRLLGAAAAAAAAAADDGEQREQQQQRESVAADPSSDTWPILNAPTDVLLDELARVDPVMADRWHPHDRRKIQRSLEIYLQTGKRASDIYAEQRARKDAARAAQGGGEQGPQMRFPALLLWVHSEAAVLRERLDRRVEKMLAEGLLDEVVTLDTFARDRAAQGAPMDDGKGIWVSIGYREFRNYIRALHSDDAESHTLAKLKTTALQATQASTRQYAKHQVRWIRIKLVNELLQAKASDKLYLLDGSDVARFQETVVNAALQLTSQYLRADAMPAPSTLSSVAAAQLQPIRADLAAAPQDWVKQYCAVCDMTAVTPFQWQQHVASKSHKKRVSKASRAEQQQCAAVHQQHQDGI